MKCLTAHNGTVSQGIKLLREPATTPDGQTRFFLHVPSDCYLLVSDDLLRSDCVRHEGDDVILMRCSIAAGRQIVPETADDAADNKAFVLGVIDGRMVTFTDAHPEPEHYRTALGPNSCCHWLYEARHLNRGPNGHTTGHEEFRFLAVLADGDSMKGTVSFYNEEGSRLKMRADGTMLSFNAGQLNHHRPVVATSF
ncbi:MAG: hypothetical protein JST01_24565 [Cyanobacteria bacterium SZAS TMP-1]|nr:hypothetical protein [Cyanobacteria bacterium SZAS TMP-1]